MSEATQATTERTVTLEIDGQEVRAEEGETILDAARRAGIDVPSLCEFENLPNVGACRMCLVEIDGDRLETACTTPVEDGMEVAVDTEQLWDHRRTILELMFSEENHYCMYCEMEGNCELQDLFLEAGLDSVRFPLEYEDHDPDTSHEYITLDYDRCINCGRCIRVCDEIVGNQTLNFGNRGRDTTIVADTDVPLGESSCVSCGACVQTCPTGSLYSNLSAYHGRDSDCEVVESVCNECSIGCDLEVYRTDRGLVKIDGTTDGPDGGQLCEKGRFERLERDDRPVVGTATIRREGELETVPIDEAIEHVADLLDDAQSVTAAASNRLPTETLDAFADAMDDVNADLEIDGADRAGLESAVREELAVHDEENLVADSVACIEDADGLVVYDTTIVETHPVAASYVRRAVKEGADLLTVDPFEDQFERFSSDSLTMGSSLFKVSEIAAEAVNDEEREAPIASAAEKAVDFLGEGNGVVVIGPEVDNQDTLVNAYGLAAVTDSQVVGLNEAANQALPDADRVDEVGEVAYLFASDDRTDDLDRMVGIARRADTVIVQAARESALTKLADVVLPALDWAEREGTFVDADGRERGITRVLEPRAPIESDREPIERILEVIA
ncbi:MAG TPA: 2Fe-2S iron-sulfur cluster-binding protein [Natrialbaceae archaeon]|nr:2Fe-2S iron-sulfur cluster-binding protein [Natrialbaceae archaeon]